MPSRNAATDSSAKAPSTTTTPRSPIIITIDEKDLERRTGHAVTTTGTLIPTRTLLTMADQAETYTAVLNGAGVPLRLDRTKRCATRHQTMALIARDIGCSFPGCAHPADYCERHHIIPWVDGGRTDLDNLTLLCVYHHHNFLQRGWTVTMNEQRTYLNGDHPPGSTHNKSRSSTDEYAPPTDGNECASGQQFARCSDDPPADFS